MRAPSSFPPFHIRPAAPADFAAWMDMALSVEASFPGMTPADHRNVMERCISRGTAFCACIEGMLAGGVAFSRGYGGVGFLAVRKACRRRGIGTLLMKEALSHMPPDRETFLHVYPGDLPARALYLSLGFREGEFIRKEGQSYQTLRLSPEKRRELLHRYRKCPAGGGSL